MPPSVSIKPYEPGDEHAISGLFGKAYGKQMSMRYWYWRFWNNPTDEIMIELAWSDGMLVGQYAVSPVVISIEGQQVLTGLSMSTMTHPDYRSRGIFAKLAESMYGRMVDNGVAIVWGFPNEYSHRGFVRDLAWVDIHEVPTFRKALDERKPLPDPPSYVGELANLDSRFDELSTEIRGKYRILARRDSNYLNWRYETNPEYRYTVFGYVEDDSLLGYAVCKYYRKEVDLVDILSVDKDVSVGLVCGVAKWAVGQNAKAINMWLNFTLPLHHELEKLGFRNAEPVTYLGGRILTSARAGVEIYNFKNWYLTMGDSDIY